MGSGGMNGVSGLLGDNGLQDMLRELEKAREAEKMALETAAEILPVKAFSPRSGSNSAMSGNFYNAGYTKSKYAQGELDAREAEQSFANKINGVVANMINQIDLEVSQRASRSPGMDFSRVVAYKNGIQARGQVQDVVDDEVRKESEQHLKTTRRDIDKAVEAAIEAAAAGENGEVPAVAPASASTAEDLAPPAASFEVEQSAPLEFLPEAVPARDISLPATSAPVLADEGVATENTRISVDIRV